MNHRYYLLQSKVTGSYCIGYTNKYLLCPWRKTIPLAFESCKWHANAPTRFEKAIRNKHNRVWELPSLCLEDCKHKYPELFI